MLVAFLLLLPATAWTSTYFWLQTPHGQARLVTLATEQLTEGMLSIESVRWGPVPDRLWLGGVMIRDAAQRPALTAESVDIDLAIGTALSVDSATIQGFGVHLRWSETGAFNLDRPWVRPSVTPAPPAPPEVSTPLVLSDLVLEDGVVTLSWPSASLRFEAVETTGTVTVGGPEELLIAAELQGKDATAVVDGHPLHFDAHRIEDFTWSGGGFRTRSVRLDADSGMLVTASGAMDFSGGTTLDATGTATLPPPPEGSLFAAWCPAGADIETVATHRRQGGPWHVDVDNASVPVLRVDGVNVRGLNASFESAFGTGSLLPQFAFRTTGATVASVVVDDWMTAEHLVVGAVEIDVGAAVEGEAKDVTLGALNLGGMTVRELLFEGGVVANLGGGKLQGTLATPEGRVRVSGPIETRVLHRQVDATVSVAFDAVTATLRTWLRGLIPVDEWQQVPDPLDGVATGRLALPASGPVEWVWTRFSWREGGP